MDYSFIDSFLKVPTWHSNHDLDNGRFYEAISPYIDDVDFDPSAFGNYLREKFPGPSYEKRIADLVSQSEIIRDFLQTTGR